jgi:hypothetical protein
MLLYAAYPTQHTAQHRLHFHSQAILSPSPTLPVSPPVLNCPKASQVMPHRSPQSSNAQTKPTPYLLLLEFFLSF